MSEKTKLETIQWKLDQARREVREAEHERNALIRKSRLTPGEIVEVTYLTKGRVSQIRGEAY